MGEPAEQCFRRASAALKRMSEENGPKPTVLVCSWLVMGIVRCITKDVPISRLWEYVLPPAATELVTFR